MQDHTATSESALKTWLVIFLLLGLILGKGLFAFFTIGDPGPPGWDYRPVPDVPAESAYAVYPPLPYPQHVRGEKGE